LVLSLLACALAAAADPEPPILGPRVNLEGQGLTISAALNSLSRQLNARFWGFWGEDPRLSQKADFHLKNATPAEAIAAFEAATGTHAQRAQRYGWWFRPNEGEHRGGDLRQLPLGSWLLRLGNIACEVTSTLTPGRPEPPVINSSLAFAAWLRSPSDPEMLRLADVGDLDVAYDHGPAAEPKIELSPGDGYCGLTVRTAPPPTAANQVDHLACRLTLAELTAAHFSLPHALAAETPTTLTQGTVEVTVQKRKRGNGAVVWVSAPLPAANDQTSAAARQLITWYGSHLLDAQFFDAAGRPLFTEQSGGGAEPRGAKQALRFALAVNDNDAVPDRLELTVYVRGPATRTVPVRLEHLPLPPRGFEGL
jgi:hypothetical protein